MRQSLRKESGRPSRAVNHSRSRGMVLCMLHEKIWVMIAVGMPDIVGEGLDNSS